MARLIPIAFELVGYAAVTAAAAMVDLRLGLAVLGVVLVLEGREVDH